MRIYIAGPYGDTNTKEQIAWNVDVADKVARDLMVTGHQVYCPHKMSWGWEDDHRLNREHFATLDKSFMELWAEGVYRIAGNSPGADQEVEWAIELGLPVFYHTGFFGVLLEQEE